MTLSQSFSLTSDLMDMVNQFNCGPDLVKTSEGARLKSEAICSVEVDYKRFNSAVLQSIFDEAALALQNDFAALIKKNFDLPLLAFNLRKDKNRHGNINYKLELMVDPNSLVTLNISKLGAVAGNDHILLLQEKPSLCWIVDSRSPFHIPGFSEMLSDISAVTSFREVMKRDNEHAAEIISGLGHQFISTVH